MGGESGLGAQKWAALGPEMGGESYPRAILAPEMVGRATLRVQEWVGRGICRARNGWGDPPYSNSWGQKWVGRATLEQAWGQKWVGRATLGARNGWGELVIYSFLCTKL